MDGNREYEFEPPRWMSDRFVRGKNKEYPRKQDRKEKERN